jgi:hypothetical protein
MTLAQAAKYAIQLGGIYDGHETSPDLHKLTKASVAALAGQGLVAAAKDATTLVMAPHFPTLPALPRSRSTLKRASITSWISSPTPMSAR